MSTTDRAVAALVRVLFRLVRLLGPDRAGALGAALARRFGPLVKAHRIALENIRQAFPDLPAAEHGRIAAAAWDNLGRTAAEYVHLDRLWDFDPESATVGRIEIAPEVTARFEALRQDGKPALFFAAHLANCNCRPSPPPGTASPPPCCTARRTTPRWRATSSACANA